MKNKKIINNLNRIIYLLTLILLVSCQKNITSEKNTTSVDSVDERVKIVKLIARSKNDNNSLSQYFSFDRGSIAQDPILNDIYFGLTKNSKPFLAFSPVNSAKGTQIENNNGQDDSQNIIFNVNECKSDNLQYNSGAMPIPYTYSKYCWITNNGSLVEFVVTNITEIIDDFQTYEITLTYVIWD